LDAAAIETVLLDIDGVLVVSWQAITGAADAVAALRRADRRLRFVTNTTSTSCSRIAQRLRDVGIEVHDGEVLTAPLATAEHLRRLHPDAACLVLSSGDAGDDLAGIRRAGPGEHVDVVVLGGAGPEFDYDALNAAFTALVDGADLVAMHRNLHWRTAEGFALDTGAFVAGLEAAAGVTATVVGKPSPAMFHAALSSADATPETAMMVGDDLHSDVLGAQAVGVAGVLVRTGKYRPADVERAARAGDGRPDDVVDSIVDVPALLGLQ
jgi:HAD superfamily hydrolase (TIGR01458 family)